MLLSATWVWWLVLVSGTEGTGYTTQPLARMEAQAKCEELRAKWLAAYPELKGLSTRLKCVNLDQKNAELNFWTR